MRKTKPLEDRTEKELRSYCRTKKILNISLGSVAAYLPPLVALPGIAVGDATGQALEYLLQASGIDSPPLRDFGAVVGGVAFYLSIWAYIAGNNKKVARARTILHSYNTKPLKTHS